MITAKQIRAARAFLDWSTSDLSAQTGLTVNGINKIERGHVLPHKETLETLQLTFENAGIEFLPLSGIKKKDRYVVIWEDNKAYERLLDDIFFEVRDTGGDVITYGLTEKRSRTPNSEEKLRNHIQRMNEAGIKERVLVKNGDTNFFGPLETYHWIDDAYFSSDPICVYGNKVALVVWEPQKIIIIDDARIATSVRLLLNYIWDRTEPVTLNRKKIR